MRVKYLIEQALKVRVIIALGLLPVIFSFTHKSNNPGLYLMAAGFILLVTAQIWGRYRPSPSITALSFIGGTIFNQSVVISTGLYASPFLFLFVIPYITYGFTDGYRWGYYAFLAYTPFLLYLMTLAAAAGLWNWLAYMVMFWSFLLMIALTIHQREIENVRQIANLKNKARRDPLTGLFNRYVLDDFYDYIKIKSRAESCTVMMFDLDEFKQHNDLLGHPAGDEMLRKVAKVLEDNVRNEDIVIRYGGDEFLFIMWGIEKDEAEIIIPRIQEKTFLEAGCSISGGFATGYINHPQDFAVLLGQADQNLYACKEKLSAR